MNSLLLAIYVIGLVIVALWVMSVIAHEPTAHGQGILLSYGILVIVLWPMVLLCALVFGAFLFVRNAVRLVRRWLR